MTWQQVETDIRARFQGRVFVRGATVRSGSQGRPVQIAGLLFNRCARCPPGRISYVAVGTRAHWYMGVADRPNATVISFGTKGCGH